MPNTWTVLTIIEEPQEIPKPGNAVEVRILDLACHRCVIDHANKLKRCVFHNRLRVWGYYKGVDIEEVKEELRQETLQPLPSETSPSPLSSS
jgi:hypothetical protein